nr:hypothetical protein [Mycoplasmopsis bovis]
MLAGQLEQLRFFKNWHKTAFNELNDIKSQIDSKVSSCSTLANSI